MFQNFFCFRFLELCEEEGEVGGGGGGGVKGIEKNQDLKRIKN